jgi:hypothetical protein
MAYVLIFLVIALLVGWLVSEFQPQRWLRITLGLCCIALCCSLAIAVGLLQRLNYNAWYGLASAELIDTTIKEVNAGRSAELVADLERLRKQFEPTYENRAHYDELVKQFVERRAARPRN